MSDFKTPKMPHTITKGIPLKEIMSADVIQCISHNIKQVHPDFEQKKFEIEANKHLAPLTLLERAQYIAQVLQKYLPHYDQAIHILLASLTPPQSSTKDLGLSGFFYLPHVCFVAKYGLDASYNKEKDPYNISMKAQYELTKRFSAEFSIRHFLIHREKETLDILKKWISDPDPHVRRLCSEGTRPRLPWAIRIPAFIKEPKKTLPILEALKDDPELYVRRSVANHLGDIAKDHPEVVFSLCERWAKNATPERKWLLRHAVRYYAKKGHAKANDIRKLAK
jgi:3-methyladenine DNA glycosylase AlkC